MMLMGCLDPDSRCTSQRMSNRRGSILAGSFTRQSRRNQLSCVSASLSYCPLRRNVMVVLSRVWVWKNDRLRVSPLAAASCVPAAPPMRTAAAAATPKAALRMLLRPADERSPDAGPAFRPPEIRSDRALIPRIVPYIPRPRQTCEGEPWRKLVYNVLPIQPERGAQVREAVLLRFCRDAPRTTTFVPTGMRL